MHAKQYETPLILLLDIKFEEIICQSLTNPSDYPDGGDPFNQLDGNCYEE